MVMDAGMVPIEVSAACCVGTSTEALVLSALFEVAILDFADITFFIKAILKEIKSSGELVVDPIKLPSE